MKNKFEIAVVKPVSVVLQTEDGNINPTKEYINLTPSQKTVYDNFILLLNEICMDNMELIPIPEEDPVYIMTKPCPVNGDLEVRVWETSYINDKEKKVIHIDIIALHFTSSGNRVPVYDCKSYVIADMSEEKKVEVTEGVWEYSYVLANTILDNGESVKTLLAKAVQIADLDGSLNQRLYN